MTGAPQFRMAEYGQVITFPRTMADVIYENTGRKVADQFYLDTLRVSMKQTEEIMAANIAARLFP